MGALYDPLATLDLKSAAEYLNLGLDSVRALADRGELPAVRFNDKHIVFLREELANYLREEGRRQQEDRKRRENRRNDAKVITEPAAPRRRGRPSRGMIDLSD